MNKAIGTLIIIIGLIFFVGMILYSSNLESSEKEVPCYDENHNKIKGLSCIENESEKDVFQYIGALFFLFTFVIGVFLITMETNK